MFTIQKSMFKFIAWFSVIGFIMLLASLISCKREATIKDFSEPSGGESTHNASPNNPGSPGAVAENSQPASTAPHFTWETPHGWTEKRSEGGFRLASFSIPFADPDTTCTIIPLKGEAGGLKANISRWLDQINVKMDNGAPLNTLVESCEKFRTKGGYSAVLADLTPLVRDKNDSAIIAAVISVGGDSIFIKIFGSQSLLVENREKFRNLCRSFASSTLSPPAQ